MIPNVLNQALSNGTITKLYHGTDAGCRCGCKGKYYERTNRGFHRVLTEATKVAAENPCEIIDTGWGLTLVNVPHGNGKAYTFHIMNK